MRRREGRASLFIGMIACANMYGGRPLNVGKADGALKLLRWRWGVGRVGWAATLHPTHVYILDEHGAHSTVNHLLIFFARCEKGADLVRSTKRKA